MIRGSFHNHTIHSDGRLTPEQLLLKYKQKKFTHLSVTDHDNAGAYGELKVLAPELGINLITGLEFSTQFRSFPECHIIGLNIDTASPDLRAYEHEILSGRKTRAESIVKKMHELGVHPDLDTLGELYTNPSIGRPHIAAILIKHGLVRTVQDGFRQYLSPGKPLYIRKHQWSSERVIALIHSLGGKAILAHPTDHFSPDDVNELVETGLDGIEVIHPMNKLKYAKIWRDYAQKNRLIISGGADFHGIEKSEDRAIGRYYLEGQDLRNLLNALEN
ncbi:MAG: PHP domain-containing protein [Bacteroidetes bacterium]|nr:PHP domain-containing protein [Bacteroidota bacterium]